MKRKKKKPAEKPKEEARGETRDAAGPSTGNGAPINDGSEKDGSEKTPESPEKKLPEKKLIDELQGQVAELTDRFQRKTAEFANYQKRIRKEREEARLYASGPLALELLSVLDSFDRALGTTGGKEGEKDVAESENDEFLQGLILIQEQFRTALANHGIVPIEALGALFDPSSHDAVMEEENPDLPDRTVMDELVKGYMLHDRLLRPARVRVARTPKAVSGKDCPAGHDDEGDERGGSGAEDGDGAAKNGDIEESRN